MMNTARQTVTVHRRYASMDGLRGFAAFSVVMYHLGHWLGAPALAQNSGLAVDLFFCLSGYVLPLAYGRMVQEELSMAGFLSLRLIRLMPLIVAAILISGTFVTFRSSFRADRSLPMHTILAGILLGLLNLPFFGAPRALGGPELFPLNGPQYSLLLELVINAVWWIMRGRGSLVQSFAIAVPCAVLLCFTGLGGDVPETFWSGFPRVGASFFLGVAVFRLEHTLTPRLPYTAFFWTLAAIMAALFYVPVPLARPTQIVWVAMVSPLLVLAASRARIVGRTQRIFTYIGELSYPLYALHYPLFCWLNGAYRSAFGPQNVVVEVLLNLLADLVACHIVWKLYDLPVRRALTKLFASVGLNRIEQAAIVAPRPRARLP